MKKLYLKLFSFLFLAGIFPFHSLCQDYVNWNVAEKYTADSLSGHYRSSLSATWIPDTHHFYYAIEKKGMRKFYLVDATKGKKKLLFDNKRLAEDISRLTQTKYTPEELKIYRLDFYNKDLSKFYIRKNNKNFEYDVNTGKIKIVSTVPEVKKKSTGSGFPAILGKKSWEKYSKDNKFYIYGRDHNLYLSHKDTLEDIQLTTDGEPYFSYTSNSSEKRDTACCYTLARWIDDTHIIFAFREDKRAIKTMTLVNSLANPRPTTDTYKMPMPGDSGVSQYDIALFNADTQEKIPVSIAKYPDQKVDISNFSNITSSMTEKKSSGGLKETGKGNTSCMITTEI